MGFTNKHVTTLAENGMEYKKARKLDYSDFDAEQITTLAQKGADPDAATALKHEGVGTDQVTTLAREKADLKMATELKRTGWSGDELVDITKKGNRKYIARIDPMKRDGSYLGHGSTLRQVKKLQADGIPKKDIKYYVDEGMSLKVVDKLNGRSISSDRLKKNIQMNSGYVRESMKYGRFMKGVTVTIGNIYWNGRSWANQNKSSNEESPS